MINLSQAIKLAQQGEQSAMRELYNEFAQSVYFLVLKVIGNEEIAEKLTVEIFTQAFTQIWELETPEEFGIWLTKIAVCSYSSMLPSEENETEKEERDFKETEIFAIPYDEIDNATAKIIVEIIDTLPIEQRECIYFHYFEKLSVLQIADLFAVPESVIKTRLALAHEHIKNRDEKGRKKLHRALPLLIVPALHTAMKNTAVPSQLFAKIIQEINAAKAAATKREATVTARLIIFAAIICILVIINYVMRSGFVLQMIM